MSFDDSKTAMEHGTDAAEAIRGINHLTHTLQYPSDVYRVLADLSLLASRLPQALGQLDARLQRWVDEGNVAVNDGEFANDPVAAVTTASVYLLEEKTPAAEALRVALDRAQQAIAFASFVDTAAEV